MTWLAISTAIRKAPSSKPLKTSASGLGPITNEASTSTGTTNSAIWALEPIAMLTDRSILSLRATSTATQCSAALPTIAITIAPTKNSVRPIDSAASEIEPTSTSDITPTATPASASAPIDLRIDQASWASDSSCEPGGLNSLRCVFSEKTRPET